jgi:hypothetical protein
MMLVTFLKRKENGTNFPLPEKGFKDTAKIDLAKVGPLFRTNTT